MKIALVHDWLTGIGGDVQVLKALHQLYPDAPIYCLTQDKEFTDEFLPGATVIASTGYRTKFLLPFYSSLIESIDLSDYDLVISTGSIFSKGLILRPKTFHINYCHSPTRQVWDLKDDYRHKVFAHGLRIWDRHASTRVDQYIANSEHVRARIKKYYRRDSTVIYPPVAPAPSTKNQAPISKHFLIVSRLYPHKNIDIAVKACNKLGWELTVIGTGPEYKRLKALAGPRVHVLGYLPDPLVTKHYALCSAFLMPQEEDFGIAGVTALMHGKPVLALKAGGALEYVEEGVNGLFFGTAHEAVLADGLRRMRETTFDPAVIRDSATKFSWQNFQSSFSNTISQTGHSRA